MKTNFKPKDAGKMGAVVLASILALTSFALIPASTYAAPPGDTRDNDVGKMLFKFNILATPKGDWSQDDTVCGNNGHRVFFERVDSGAIGSILWQLDPAVTGIRITDCDGTSDKLAVINADEKQNFYVMIRVHGKATDSLTVTCTELKNDIVTGDELCLIDTETFAKGKSFTKIMTNIFDNEYEEVLWTLETNTGFKNAEVRIYERIL